MTATDELRRMLDELPATRFLAQAKKSDVCERQEEK